MSGMENLEKAAMIAAVAAEVAAGGQAVKTENADSLQNDKAKTEYVSEYRNGRTEVQKDARGNEFVIIDGKKFTLAPKGDLTAADQERIDHPVKAVASENTDNSIKVARADEQEN
jgi:hypothetical protein